MEKKLLKGLTGGHENLGTLTEEDVPLFVTATIASQCIALIELSVEVLFYIRR